MNKLSIFEIGKKIHFEPLLKTNYEFSLWNFIKTKTEDSRAWDLKYISSLDTFKKLNNEKLLRAARNELIRQGFVISFYSWDLDGRDKVLNDGKVFNFSELIWMLNYKERYKVFLDQFDEETIITEYRNKKKKFGDRRTIINVTCFDTMVGFNSFTDGRGVDEMNRTWLYHWEETQNFWFENYYPFIKNELK